MKCKKCKYSLDYTGNENLTKCSICGSPMSPSMEDVFKHRMYGIIKEIRPEQLKMAKNIDNFYNKTEDKVQIIEGGTGIGKSFAYLIPALKITLEKLNEDDIETNKRLIISTAKKTLQEQLVNKDIPYLLNKMNLDIKYTQLKGNADYLCLRRASDIPIEDRDRYTIKTKEAITNNIHIDLNDWGKDRPYWWDIVNVDNCPDNKKCKHREYCKPNSRRYDIVVVNHHLLAIDLLSTGHILGKYDYLIIDEAHQATEAFRSALTENITRIKIQRIQKEFINNITLRTLIQDYISRNLPTEIIAITDDLSSNINKLINYADKNKNSCNCVPLTAKLTTIFKEILPKITDLYVKIESIMNKLRTKSYDLNNDKKEEKETSKQLFKALSKLNRINKTIINLKNLVIRTLKKPDEYILTKTEFGIESTPINIGEFFNHSIQEIDKCILTSATLSINKSFKYTLDSFGLPNNTSRIIYESPYNLNKQARLYMPIDLPLPGYGDTPAHTKWINALTTEVAQIAGVIKYNILVLFTSNTDKNNFYNKLKEPLKDIGLTPIDQGQNAQIALKTYLKSKNPILFGLKSFWEGIDLPGDKLRCVIITKLPFPHIKDPIIHTLLDKADNGFNDILIPKMIFDMKQGTGRLIRSMADKGIIVCLDTRIWTGTSNTDTHNDRINKIKRDPNKQRIGYGKQLVNALGYTIQSRFKAMEHWSKTNLPYLEK